MSIKLKDGLNATLSGNASTATTLKNARTINGTSFNGSANITTANWGTARTITVGNTGKSVNGSGNISWSLSEIGAAEASHTHSYLPLSGGTLTGNLTFNNGNGIYGSSGKILSLATDGETIISSQKANDWIYFRPNGSESSSGQIIVKNNGILQTYNSVVVNGGQVGIENASEAIFKSFNHNKGLFINQDKVGFYNWSSNDNLFTIEKSSNANYTSLGTMELFFSNYSNTENGYTKLPNGFILQWGKIVLTGDKLNGYDSWPNFPIAFPNDCLRVVGNINSEDAYTNVRLMPGYIQRSNKHSYHLRIGKLGLPYEHTISQVIVEYFAIGY